MKNNNGKQLGLERHYPRDLIGYGDCVPRECWPRRNRLAVQFVVNYEEGAESNILHGDSRSECYLSELVGVASLESARNLAIESTYEYGSRVGFWRLLRLFNRHNIKFTTFAVGMALARNPDVAQALRDGDHEIASHGWRWIDYQNVPEATEREHIRLAVETLTALTGSRPLGWYTGRAGPNTRRLVVEDGGFLYDSDSYADDLPYWEMVGETLQLIVPYTLDVNDMKFCGPQGFNSGEQFFDYMKDSFDCLYDEGRDLGRMMSIGLHCRIAGRPGRVRALERFLEYIQKFEDVWICRRIDIARHWRMAFPYRS